MPDHPGDDTEEATSDASTALSEALETTQASSTYKVLGEFSDASGAGVLGRNTAGSGTPIGVEGAVPNASGGYGLATPHDAKIEGTTITPALGAPASTALTLLTDAGTRALRLGLPGIDSNSNTAGANVVGGYPDNSANTAVGATIAGGGSAGSQTVNGSSRPNTNEVFDHYGTIAGGQNNRAGTPDGTSDTATHATVSGGEQNTASAYYATVGGGAVNTASANQATVGGGHDNTASDWRATVGGGVNNTASDGNATVGGGSGNDARGYVSTVGGGQFNEAHGGESTIGGGYDNRAGTSGTSKGVSATVPGGSNNVAREDYSFAAGRKAKAFNTGAFVWADSTDTAFSSTGADQFLVDAGGGVGVGTDSPATQLHVVDSVSGAASTPNHVAAIENTSSAGSADVLSLKINEAASDIGSANNFITFKDANDDAVGAIEGDGSGGITIKDGSGDFAEYMPRLDPDETIEPADIVGVVGDAVTKHTADADQALVVSDQAIVTGNCPGYDADACNQYEVCAFIGQVPVKVRGPVTEGDLIVPSGEHDGTGRAITPADYHPDDGPLVGRAWEHDDTEDVTEVTVAVGLETGEALTATLADQQETIEDLETETDDLRGENAELRATNEQLRERLAALEDQVAKLTSDAGGSAAPADD